MNRESFRKYAKYAKSKGIDVNNPDLSIVTHHYKSDYIQVITEKSSYVIDLPTSARCVFPVTRLLTLNKTQCGILMKRSIPVQCRFHYV